MKNNKTKLSKEQQEWVFSQLQTKPYKEIAPEIYEKFGIEFNTESLRHYMHRHGYKAPRDGKFCKGHPSLNKGKPAVYKSEQAKHSAAATQFKPGFTPHNWVPIGAQTGPDENGYYKIKVSDDRSLPSRKNWRYKHRMIYEENFGPIPKGYAVVFLDGDRENLNPENLYAVPFGAKSIFSLKFGYTGDPEANKASWLLATMEYLAHKKEKE